MDDLGPAPPGVEEAAAAVAARMLAARAAARADQARQHQAAQQEAAARAAAETRGAEAEAADAAVAAAAAAAAAARARAEEAAAAEQLARHAELAAAARQAELAEVAKTAAARKYGRPPAPPDRETPQEPNNHTNQRRHPATAGADRDLHLRRYPPNKTVLSPADTLRQRHGQAGPSNRERSRSPAYPQPGNNPEIRQDYNPYTALRHQSEEEDSDETDGDDREEDQVSHSSRTTGNSSRHQPDPTSAEAIQQLIARMSPQDIQKLRQSLQEDAQSVRLHQGHSSEPEISISVVDTGDPGQDLNRNLDNAFADAAAQGAAPEFDPNNHQEDSSSSQPREKESTETVTGVSKGN